MAMEYVNVGVACDDCTIAIANDDYSGMDDSQAQQTRAGLARIGQILIVGEEVGYQRTGCNVCRRHSHGNKHEVGYLVPLKVSISRIRLNGGGYDRRGRYWGNGAPLFHVASDYDDVNFEIRVPDREAAIEEVTRRYPGVRFHRGAGRPRGGVQ
jgi:hypothetical protein